ncbi:MAG: DNA internalization-related competence protein ComEC/Rec2 [Candidatus Izimaplasma sp.]|nr:DNA internalization-related competence protein ComEC/Rec2 [Candidatus Izimaplasma bacterium]
MIRLRTILQSNSSKYIHLALLITLSIFALKIAWLIVLVAVYLIYLYKKAKTLFIISLLFLSIIFFRLHMLNLIVKENLPMIGEVNEVFDKHIIIKNKNKYIVYFENTKNLKPGMIINIEGTYIENDAYNIIHTFNYNLYLKSEGIKGVIKADKITYIHNEFNLKIFRFQIEKYLEKEYSSISGYLKMFLIGNKEDLSPEIYEKSNKIGISHLFAISGMHLALIVGFINIILNFFYLKKSTYNIIIYIFLFCYTLITGFSISIIRASLLIASLMFAKQNNYIVSTSDLLSFSFIFLLIINPYYIFNIGFQFSYIIAFTLVLNRMMIKNKERIKQIFIVGLFANLISLPIILEMNKEIGLLNIFLNVFFVIIVAYLLLPGAFIVLLIPGFSSIYLKLTIFLEQTIEYLDRLNYYLSFNFTNTFIKLSYWVLLFWLIVYINKRKKYQYLILLFIFMLFFGNISYIPNLSFVRILDVNQGDAIHIHSGSCNMLIDTGNDDNYDNLINYLNGSNIRKLDSLVITHNHIDHYGETNDLIEEMDISKIYVNKKLNAINANNQIVISKDEYIKCGKSNFIVLNSNNNLLNENNNSIVLYGKVGSDKWLFTGDIGEEIEKEIIANYNLEIDQLKVAHHGSKSSSSNDFLDIFKPEEGYISVGKNSYGLPDNEVINLFRDKNINLSTTLDHGSITIYYFKGCRLKEYYYNNKSKYIFILNHKIN